MGALSEPNLQVKTYRAVEEVNGSMNGKDKLRRHSSAKSGEGAKAAKERPPAIDPTQVERTPKNVPIFTFVLDFKEFIAFSSVCLTF